MGQSRNSGVNPTDAWRDAAGMAEFELEAAEKNRVDYLRALKSSEAGRSVPGSAAPVEECSEPAAPDRRRHPRYKCNGSVEFRTEGSNVRTWATFTDLSRSGCYVEMMSTSPPGTKLDLVLELNGIRVRTTGLVKVTYPFLGMGIEFVAIPEEDVPRLEKMLRSAAQTSGELRSLPCAGQQAVASAAVIGDAPTVLNAIVKFFDNHSHLTRDDFLQLVRECQKPPAFGR